MISLGFVADFGTFAYLLIFFLIAVSGLGISFGEEAMLLFVGYLSYKGIILLPVALVVAFLGVVVADNLGFHVGSRLFRWFPRLIRWFPGFLRKSCRVREKLRDYRYIFVSRFIPNIRMVVPVAAGFYGLSWRRFFRCNVFAAAVFVPLLVALGLFAGPQINLLVSFFVSCAEIVLFVLAGLVLFYLVFRFLRAYS